MSEVPEGLHDVQYALHLLQEVLAWPAKTNIELIADCLTAIQKSKRLSAVQAYKYLVRAIGIAKEQGIKVDRMFFMNGEYTTVRPHKEEREKYVKTDWEAVRKHQSSPEFDAAWKEMQERCSKAFGIPIRKGAK